MSDKLPYTLLGLLGVFTLLRAAGRGVNTCDPHFFAGRPTERRP
jgi:hypothetical protein